MLGAGSYGPFGYLSFSNWCNREKYCKYFLLDHQRKFKFRLREKVRLSNYGEIKDNQTVEVKLEASVKAAKKSTRKKGNKVKYDGYVDRDGFIWIGIHTKYGTRYYVKARNSKTGKALGTFK
ncbi:hypothetical protein B5G82_01905 [Listeria monocytogenes]|nr:hypothetical protein [Listeria monocytogenes]